MNYIYIITSSREGEDIYCGTLREAEASYKGAIKRLDPYEGGEVGMMRGRLDSQLSRRALALACLTRQGFVEADSVKVLKSHVADAKGEDDDGA